MKLVSSIAAAGLAGALFLSPGLARADDVVVESSTVVTTTNTPVIASGVVTFGLAWGVGAIAGSMSDNEADERLYVPLVGPWLVLADRPDCPIEEQQCDSQTTEKILIGVDGVIQAVGVFTAVYGILTPRTHVIGNDHLHLVPVAMKNGGRGFALRGSF